MYKAKINRVHRVDSLDLPSQFTNSKHLYRYIHMQNVKIGQLQKLSDFNNTGEESHMVIFFMSNDQYLFSQQIFDLFEKI